MIVSTMILRESKNNASWIFMADILKEITD